MHDAGVKPLKALGTRWIDHKVPAMGCLVKKFDLYVHHLNEVVAKTPKSTDYPYTDYPHNTSRKDYKTDGCKSVAAVSIFRGHVN